MKTLIARTCFLLLILGGLFSCRSIHPTLPNNPATNPKVKFLLTFDDGPSARKTRNPTLSILDQLATNEVQSPVCAIFFIQTQHRRGVAKPKGMDVLQEIPRRGQLVGLHSVSPRGHVDHTTIPTNQLTSLLLDGKQLLNRVSGEDPLFVRPPYGVTNPITRAIYHELHLNLLMADITAHDGIIYGYKASLRRRINIRNGLTSIRNQLVKNPDRLTPYPIILAFHDVNPYTARHLTEYLHIIMEEATRAGLSFPDRPFYDNPSEASAAALQRLIPPP